MPESARGLSPTYFSISQIALDGGGHLYPVSPFQRSTKPTGRRICASSDPVLRRVNVLRRNMGRLPFFLQPRSDRLWFLGQRPLAVLPRPRYRGVQSLLRGMPKNRFKNRFTTFSAIRATSRTSIPWGVTGERPPVAKTVAIVGTAKTTTSDNQNFGQSAFLSFMRQFPLPSSCSKYLRCMCNYHRLFRM